MSAQTPDGNVLRRQWERLSAKQRRLVVVGSLGAVLVLVVYLFVTATPSAHHAQNKRTAIVSDILTSANTRELGLGGLNNRTHHLEDKITALQKRLTHLSGQLDQANKKAVSQADLKKEFDQLRATLKASAKQSRKPAPAPTPAQTPAGGAASPAPAPVQGESGSRSASLWAQPAPIAHEPAAHGAHGEKRQLAGPAPIKIRVIESADTSTAEKKAARERAIGTYLPAGSIISGRLITGMDAPTNHAAQSNPFPALVRVKKDAILPNRYRLDVRECFIIASGYGSLSAERAYLRAETLSCVKNNGGVIEVPLHAYAAGEDGKVGLRGRVVSKQGRLLAKSLAAGFWGGVSQVFNRVQVPTISTQPGLNGNGQQLYQRVLSTDSITAGVVRGAGSALDRLAKFYLNMAKDIYPVIEINANREIAFIVTQGGRLKTVSPDPARPATASPSATHPPTNPHAQPGGFAPQAPRPAPTMQGNTDARGPSQ